MYQLRNANDNDFKFVFNLNKTVNKDYIVKVWGNWDDEFQKQFCNNRFKTENIQIISKEDKEIGILELKENEHQIYIEEIQIVPSSQGKGIGTKIINDVIQKAYNLNKSVGLRVLKINRAKELYEKLGFSVIGETDTHYSMEATLLDKRTTFDNIVFDYDEARPGYPDELFSDIVEFSSLKSNENVLEIGAGTGQATDYFVKRGYSITGLEIGSKQVEFLSKKYARYPNFLPICTQFEEYENTNDKYKLILSATAFHWIKAEIGYPKAYSLLQGGGTIAVFWHMSPITKHETEMFSEMRSIYNKYAPELETSKNAEQIEYIHNLRLSQLQTSNLFGVPHYRNYSWTDEYTTERYIKLLNTFSSFQVLNSDKRKLVLNAVADYINRKNGLVQVPQEVRLYMAIK